METILHRIKAYLYDNLLTEDPNDFSARVISERSLTIKQVCELAVARGGADVSAASMQHATELFFKEMGYNLCDGFSVNTGYFTATPLIKGVFNSPTENFSPEKHTILFQFNQGEALRKMLPSIEVEVLGVADTGIQILQVTDVKSGTINDLLTPNRNLKISGHKIKIAGEHPDNGVFFVDQSTDERISVDPSDWVVNNPSEIIVVIPELSAGTYQLEITTQYAVGSLLKEPRTATFEKTLIAE